MIPHQKVGYVVPKDPKDIAGAILDFFKNERATEFSENIREEKKKFSWDAFSERLVGLSGDLGNGD